MGMGSHTHFKFEYICIYMYLIMHKLICYFTHSQLGIQILPSLNQLPVIKMGLLIQWFSKVIYWLVSGPDLMYSNLPSIHITPEVI